MTDEEPVVLLPNGQLMEGVSHALNQWATLERSLTDGRIREISNSGCERALRAVVIGRKNWLWLGFEEGARAGVVLLSLVQSCKELGINPLLYLRDVLPAISSTPASRVGDLLTGLGVLVTLLVFGEIL
ncbi:MAG: transposase, partial [Dehalococcoidia bacterium]